MRNIKLSNLKFHYLLYYFVVYSFIGWCIETVYVSLSQGRFVNRGFLYGPFCPVYGFGALILIIFLKPLKNNPLLHFIGAAIITSILEYFTAFLLETFFHVVLWDYSNEAFNIKGRICLKFSAVWMIIAVVMLNVIHPYIHHMVSIIPGTYRSALSCVIILYFIVDFTAAVTTITGIDSYINRIYSISSSISTKFEYLKESSVEKAEYIGHKVQEIESKYRFLPKMKLFGNQGLMRTVPAYIWKNTKNGLNAKRVDGWGCRACPPPLAAA